jgi:hypothetical protein
MVISAVIAGLITWLFMYIDARLFDTPKSKFTYVKGIVFVGSVAALIVYFMGSGRTQTGGGSVRPVNMGTSMLQGIGEEILTGIPNF